MIRAYYDSLSKDILLPILLEKSEYKQLSNYNKRYLEGYINGIYEK